MEQKNIELRDAAHRSAWNAVYAMNMTISQLDTILDDFIGDSKDHDEIVQLLKNARIVKNQWFDLMRLDD